MPTIKEKIYFNYDGIWSSDYDLLHVTTESGFFEESLTASRSILETKVKGKDKPHFAGFDSSPMEIEMSIAFEFNFTDEILKQVGNWLVQDYYKPLYFEGGEGRIFYCMAVGDVKITHNGAGGGYLTILMRCDSPYVYSPVIMSQQYTVPSSGIETIEFFNEGYGDLFPEISINKIGAGSVTIVNVTNGSQSFTINGLENNEDVYLNTEKEIIDTDLSDIGVYRYDGLVGDFTYLLEGQNVLEVSGNCLIQFRYQFKYRF